MNNLIKKIKDRNSKEYLLALTVIMFCFFGTAITLINLYNQTS